MRKVDTRYLSELVVILKRNHANISQKKKYRSMHILFDTYTIARHEHINCDLSDNDQLKCYREIREIFALFMDVRFLISFLKYFSN